MTKKKPVCDGFDGQFTKMYGKPFRWSKRTEPKMSSDDKKPIVAFGYNLDESGAPIRETIKPREGDYGADPLGDGTFRMVPSGDIVDLAERKRRLP